MPIRFTCSGCGKPKVTNEVNAGQMVRCSCGQILTVPSLGEDESESYEVAECPPEPEPQPLEVDDPPDMQTDSAAQGGSRRRKDTVSAAAAFSQRVGKWSLLILLAGLGMAVVFILLGIATDKNETVLLLGTLSADVVTFLWAVAVLVAIVSGAIGLISIAVSSGSRTGTGKAVGGMLCAGIPMALVAIATLVVMPAISLARGEAARSACQRNLVLIGKAISRYEGEHQRALYHPNGSAYALAMLYPRHVRDPNLFVCPAADPATALQFPAGTSLAGRPCCYEYIFKERAGKGWRQEVIVRDLPHNHASGANLLYADGHVEFSSGADARTAVAQSSPTSPMPSPGTSASNRSAPFYRPKSRTPAGARPSARAPSTTQPTTSAPARPSRPPAKSRNVAAPTPRESPPAATAFATPPASASSPGTRSAPTSVASPQARPEPRAPQPAARPTSRPAPAAGLANPPTRGEPRLAVSMLTASLYGKIKQDRATLMLRFAIVDDSVQTRQMSLLHFPPFSYELKNAEGTFLRSEARRGRHDVPTTMVNAVELRRMGCRMTNWSNNNRFGFTYSDIPADTYTLHVNVPGFKPLVLKAIELRSQVSQNIGIELHSPDPEFLNVPPDTHEPWEVGGPPPPRKPDLALRGVTSGVREQAAGRGTLEFEIALRCRVRGLAVALGTYRVLDAGGKVVAATDGPLRGEIKVPATWKYGQPLTIVRTGVPPGMYRAVIQVDGAPPLTVKNLEVKAGHYRKPHLSMSNVPWLGDLLPQLVEGDE